MEYYNIETEIDWNNIFILDEFVANFEENDYIEFSSLSKSIRYKLKSYIFNSMGIKRLAIAKILNNNIINDKVLKDISTYFEFLQVPFDKKSEFKLNLEHLSSSSQLVLKQLFKEELKSIRKFVLSFSIYGFYKGFYFLCPIVLDFTNLTQLNLKNCFFPLLTMLRIGEHLKNLKILNLINVGLIVISKQELSPEDAYLPRNLEKLTFYSFDVYNIFIAPNMINFDIAHQKSGDYGLKHLQGLKIPTLKKLITTHDDENELLLRFLKSNPQVEELFIDSYEMTQDISDQISISVKLTNITIVCEQGYPYISEHKNLNIPKFNYVENLKLKFIYYSKSVGNFQSITHYFPKLSHLILNLDEADFEELELNKFLKINLSSINTLDKLTLELKESSPIREFSNFDLYDFKFEWANFVNIKHLILDIDRLHFSSIDFNSLPLMIKEIKKKLYFKGGDLIYIEENPRKFKAWNTKFKGSYVYFTNKIYRY